MYLSETTTCPSCDEVRTSCQTRSNSLNPKYQMANSRSHLEAGGFTSRLEAFDGCAMRVRILDLCFGRPKYACVAGTPRPRSNSTNDFEAVDFPAPDGPTKTTRETILLRRA